MINLAVRKFGYVFQIALSALACLIAFVLIVPGPFAAEFLKGKNVHLTSLHRIDGDVYASGSDVTIDGSIGGDLLAVGETITTTGEISGSLMIVAGKLIHTGQAEGSIRVIVDRAEIDGYVGRSILFFGNTLEINRGAVIRGDVNAYGNRVNLAGAVRGDVTIKATKIDVSGQIDGNVDLEAGESIRIRPPAVIHGDLTYTCSNELDLGDESGITVLGDITRLEPVDSDEEEGEGTTATALRFSLLFAAFLFGMILIRLCPTYLSQAFEQLHHRFMASAGTGLLTAAVVIMCSLVLIVAVALSLVGLILTANDQVAGGMLLLIFSTLLLPITSLACVSGGVLFYVGKLLPAWLIGYGLVRIFKKQPKQLGKWQLLIGLTILTSFFLIPGGGILLYLAAGIVGIGAIILSIREMRRRLQPTKSEATEEPPVDNVSIDPPIS